jgi:hypothetical protein
LGELVGLPEFQSIAANQASMQFAKGDDDNLFFNNPGWGQFVLGNPTRFADGTNPYTYARLAPTQNIDTTGLIVGGPITVPCRDNSDLHKILNLKQCAFLIECLMSLDISGHWHPKGPPEPPPIIRIIPPGTIKKPDEDK